jgi:peptidoglycan glycosyltransferase
MGQGKILVTPLQMALVAASVANDGQMMKPTLVDKVTTNDGYLVKAQKPSVECQVMSKDTAEVVKDMMINVVDKGTGRNAAIKGIKVAGKTGTAENELSVNEKNKEHAWFVGFAPAENPQIAVAVILEYNGSTGGSAAAPVARGVISSWLNK